MDELKFGSKNKRGDFAPKEHLQIAPYFEFPPSPKKLFKFLIGYLWPWNLLYIALAALFYFYLTPSPETTKTLAPGWIAFILARNAIELECLSRRHRVKRQVDFVWIHQHDLA